MFRHSCIQCGDAHWVEGPELALWPWLEDKRYECVLPCPRCSEGVRLLAWGAKFDGDWVEAA